MPLPEQRGFGGFIERVAERSFGAAFPMFREADPALERAEGPALRRANATAYLDARAGRAPLLLVGEAMGYAGGRFSGIAFTAERTLLGWGTPFEATSLRPEGWAEQSGTIVHGALAALGIAGDTVLWNVAGASAPPGRAALEPHARSRRAARGRGGAGRADRAPGAARHDRRRAQRRARAGRARPALSRSVRHPANGGATAFRSGLAGLFRLRAVSVGRGAWRRRASSGTRSTLVRSS